MEKFVQTDMVALTGKKTFFIYLFIFQWFISWCCVFSSPVMNFVKITIRITELLIQLSQATNLFSLQMGKYNTYASFWRIVVGVGRSSLVSLENRYCFDNQKQLNAGIIQPAESKN